MKGNKFAYIAGFFDAEGSLTIAKFKTATNPRYQLRVIITNSNLKNLKWIKRCFANAGHIKRHSDSLTTFELEFMSKKALKFLLKIESFLILKKKEAELGIDFQKALYRTGGKFLPIEKLEFRESQKKKMTSLHLDRIINFNEQNLKEICPYLAGFIDGDGSISILHKNTLTITIVSKEKGILEGLNNIFKVGFIYYGSGAFRWIISSRDAQNILLQIIPYLKIKKKEASLAIKFQSSINIRNRRKVKETELKVRQKIIEKIKSYHLKKGLQINNR